jgi:hypothetical protein
MTNIYGHVNRPVHLARRDAFYERSVELLYLPHQQLTGPTRLQVTDDILACLGEARQHAFYASRSESRTDREMDFLQFMDLILENVDSLAAMLRHQSHLEEEQGFLGSFLGTTREQASMPAFHYQRRAEDILQGLWHLLRLAQTPYSQLRQHGIDNLDEEERNRYEIAYRHFSQQASEKFKTPETLNEKVSHPGA